MGRPPVWNKEKIVQAIQMFHTVSGTVPDTLAFRECHGGLPAPATLLKHFASLGEALHAAGLHANAVQSSKRHYHPWRHNGVARQESRASTYQLKCRFCEAVFPWDSEEEQNFAYRQLAKHCKVRHEREQRHVSAKLSVVFALCDVEAERGNILHDDESIPGDALLWEME